MSTLHLYVCARILVCDSSSSSNSSSHLKILEKNAMHDTVIVFGGWGYSAHPNVAALNEMKKKAQSSSARMWRINTQRNKSGQERTDRKLKNDFWLVLFLWLAPSDPYFITTNLNIQHMDPPISLTPPPSPLDAHTLSSLQPGLWNLLHLEMVTFSCLLVVLGVTLRFISFFFVAKTLFLALEIRMEMRLIWWSSGVVNWIDC